MATQCGSNICYDDDAYCCLDDYGEEECCVGFYYYQTWWFWFIWGTFLFILLACSIGCYRSCRRRRATYVVLRNPQQPVYGSVVVTSHAQSQGSHGVMPVASAPVQPPPYTAYPQQKPPAYGQP